MDRPHSLFRPSAAALVLLLSVLLTLSCGNRVILTDLRVNGEDTLLGTDDTAPDFSWMMNTPEAGQCQTAYRVVVSTDMNSLVRGTESSDPDLYWDSGRTDSPQSRNVEYCGKPLSPQTRYYWKVSVWDKDGKMWTSSGKDWFETGLMMENPFDGVDWLSGNADGVAPMFRREFQMPGDITGARLYVTSAGIYDIEINGYAADDSRFNPGRTQYPIRTMYQTYDITELLKEGDNAIGVTLGRGWMSGANSNFNFGEDSPLGFAAMIVAVRADGSRTVVSTDPEWRFYGDGPIRYDDIFQGEIHDARKNQDGWSRAGFDDSGWKSPAVGKRTDFKIGSVVCQDGPYVRRLAELPALSVTEPVEGVFVYDFGQNISGVCRVKVTGKEGQTIILRQGEKLNSELLVNSDDAPGTIWTTNLNICRNEDRYTLSGNPDGEVFEPKFVYRGFQYMQLTGLDEPVPPEDVKAVVIGSSLQLAGSFECSDPDINRLVENAWWSMTDNFLSVPTDCPQRNERLGWTGDAQIFARTASYFADVRGFFRKYMTDVRDGQNELGIYPVFSPAPALAHGKAAGGWCDAGVIIPWQMYLQYGDESFIRDNYESMCRYVDRIIADCDDYIDVEGRFMGDMFGDWEAYEHTPLVITETAYCAWSTLLLSKMAAVIGEDEDAAEYARHFEAFRTAWNREFVNEDGSMKCDPKKYGTGEFGNKTDPEGGMVETQAAYVLGLRFGLFPEELREKAAARLADLMKKYGFRLRTGFAGVSYINPVLTECGYVDAAYSLLEQREFPSWLFPVVNGATTIYESWQSYIEYPDGTYRYLISMNHFPAGSVVEWLYRYVGGIESDPEQPGFRRIILQPSPGGSLTYARCSYRSDFGTIRSDWDTSGGALSRYAAVVPPNSSAVLYLPVNLDVMSGFGEVPGVHYEGMAEHFGRECAKFTLSSGSFEFLVEDGRLTVRGR